MRNLRLAALALTCLTAPLAFAQKAPGGLYGELGYTMITLSPTNFPDFKPTVLRGIVGYQLNSNFSVEGQLGMGLADGTAMVDQANAEANVKVSSMYGLYAKAKTELAPGFEAFGRAGYAKADATIKVNSIGYSESNSKDGFSWGIGAAYAISPAVALTVDYMSYFNKDDVKASGYTLGVQFNF